MVLIIQKYKSEAKSSVYMQFTVTPHGIDHWCFLSLKLQNYHRANKKIIMYFACVLHVSLSRGQSFISLFGLLTGNEIADLTCSTRPMLPYFYNCVSSWIVSTVCMCLCRWLQLILHLPLRDCSHCEIFFSRVYVTCEKKNYTGTPKVASTNLFIITLELNPPPST